jgi:hypothetical protein
MRAVIPVTPGESAVTRPDRFTLATASLSLDQLSVTGASCAAMVTTARKVAVSPAESVMDCFAIVI